MLPRCQVCRHPGPVHLIEINGVDLQAAETIFAFAANGFGAEFLVNLPFSFQRKTHLVNT